VITLRFAGAVFVLTTLSVAAHENGGQGYDPLTACESNERQSTVNPTNPQDPLENGGDLDPEELEYRQLLAEDDAQCLAAIAEYWKQHPFDPKSIAWDDPEQRCIDKDGRLFCILGGDFSPDLKTEALFRSTFLEVAKRPADPCWGRDADGLDALVAAEDEREKAKEYGDQFDLAKWRATVHALNLICDIFVESLEEDDYSDVLPIYNGWLAEVAAWAAAPCDAIVEPPQLPEWWLHQMTKRRESEVRQELRGAEKKYEAVRGILSQRGIDIKEERDEKERRTRITISGLGGEPVRPAASAQPFSIPLDLLRIPGWITEVMDECLRTAPYPNQAMAFAGAVTALSALTGRIVADAQDNRTNISVLALGYSASGKDWPRKLNKMIFQEAGLAQILGEQFGSGQGMEDALQQNPVMLYMTDEIACVLREITRSKEAKGEAVLGTSMRMFSNANSIYTMRTLAGGKSKGTICQPHLVILGTAVPGDFYEALSGPRLLTNGFVARILIVEAGPRGNGQEASRPVLSESILEAARSWKTLQAGEGDLLTIHPHPRIVECTAGARKLLLDHQHECDAAWKAGYAKQEEVTMAIWGRANEHARKLALLHACSVNHREPRISEEAVRWSTAFANAQVQHLLASAGNRVAVNEFHETCLKVKDQLRKQPNREMAWGKLLKNSHMKAKDLLEIAKTLGEAGEIEIRVPEGAKNNRGTVVKLLEG
jgi:hypothetical protein